MHKQSVNAQSTWRQNGRKAAKALHRAAKVAQDVMILITFVAWLIHLFH